MTRIPKTRSAAKTLIINSSHTNSRLKNSDLWKIDPEKLTFDMQVFDFTWTDLETGTKDFVFMTRSKTELNYFIKFSH